MKKETLDKANKLQNEIREYNEKIALGKVFLSKDCTTAFQMYNNKVGSFYLCDYFFRFSSEELLLMAIEDLEREVNELQKKFDELTD